MKFKLPKSADVSLLKLYFLFIALPTILVLITVCDMQKEIEHLKVTHEVFFDITIDEKSEGRIAFGLFGEIVPETVRNFYTFSTSGFQGLKYEGTKFHRIIRKFMIHGGDVVYGNGSGRLSIYGQTFPDENFRIKHATSGFLSMANSGKDSNGCQFFITTLETSWLDGHNVAFGKVIEGQALVHKIEYLEVDKTNRPLKEVKIVKSGSRPLLEPYWISNDPYNLIDWLKTISIPLSISFGIIFLFSRFMKKLDSCIDAEEELLQMEEDMAKEIMEKELNAEEEKEIIDEEGISQLIKRNKKVHKG